MLTIYCRLWSILISVVNIPNETPLEKPIFFFAISCGESFLVRDGIYVYFTLSGLGLTCAGPMQADTVSVSVCVCQSCVLETLSSWYLLPTLSLKIYLAFLLKAPWTLHGGLMKTFHLGLSVPKTLTLSSCESLY